MRAGMSRAVGRCMHRSSPRIILALLAGLLPACTAGDSDDPGGAPADLPAASSDLRVDLAARQDAYMAGEPVLVDVTITNTSARQVKLLSWMLPAADLEEPVFVITTQGRQRVAFLGAHYKRPGAEAGDFVHLGAGASISRQVDLAHL
jgi:hypothetical protein